MRNRTLTVMPLDGVQPPVLPTVPGVPGGAGTIPPPAPAATRPVPGAPRLPGDLVRMGRARRLLDRRAAVTLVSGMPGFGKSTLVASWLQDQGDAVDGLWVRVRPGTTAHDALAGLRDAGHDEPARPVVAVIDDAHLLPADDLVTELDHLLSTRSELSVILIGRGLSVLEPRLVGVLDTVPVPPAELMFGRDEMERLAALNGVTLDHGELERLHGAVGGWPAATSVVLRELGDNPGPLPLSRAVDYLESVVFPSLPDRPSLHELLRFAVPERLTRRLLHHLAGDALAEQILEYMFASGLAQRRYLDDDVELVFPRLLRDRARRIYTDEFPDEARELHRTLAQWYLLQVGGQSQLAALLHARGAADFALVERIWARYAAPLTSAHPAEIVEFADGLPAAFRDRHPSVALAQQVARALLGASDEQRRGEGSRAYLASLPSADLDGLEASELVQIASARIAAQRSTGDLPGALRLGDAVAARVQGADPTVLGDHLAWLHMQRGFTLLGLYRLQESAEAFQRGWGLRDDPTGWIQATITANLALSKAVVGDLPEARRWLHRAGACDVRGFWAGEVCEAIAATTTGLLALDRLEDVPDEAELGRALEILGQTELWPFAVYVSSVRDLHFRDPERALASLGTLVRQQPGYALHTPVARILVTRMRSDLLLAVGDFRRARGLLDVIDPRRSHPALIVARARLALLTGDLDGAADLASVVLEQRQFALRTELDLALLLAEVHARLGREADAERYVRRALGVHRATGLLRSFDAVDPDVRASLLTGRHGAQVLDRLATRTTGRTFPAVRRPVTLTPRERVLATELRRTGSRQEIADTLFVSANTVRSQLTTLYRKLGVTNRAEALDRLAELGL